MNYLFLGPESMIPLNQNFPVNTERYTKQTQKLYINENTYAIFESIVNIIK